MMAVKSLALALAAGAHLASAHFGLVYPPWRTDSLNSKDPSISQWTYPCAGVPANITGNNVTDWPLDGGSLKLGLHHAWEYIFINLGLAANAAGDVTNFNISLTPQFLNSSGKGDLCIPQLKLPAAFKPAEGARASIQVVTVGAEGSALYNCADIRFTANATVLKGDACPANPNITYYPVKQQTANGTLADGSGSGSGGSGGNSSAGGGKSAGSLAGVDKTALASVVGLTAALVYGLGF